MNRLKELFKNKKNNLLSVYFTAGYPKLEDTLIIAKELENAGVDFLEIGFPYSDPLADGPVIQKSSEVAIENGMTLNKLFDQLKFLREHISIPVLLMGYVNPVLQYGVKEFCLKAKEVGVDGVIVPDLPVYEYNEIYKNDFLDNDLSNIFLITPQTSDKRILEIDELSNGFIYMLSSSSTTGKDLNISDKITDYYLRVKNLSLKNNLIIGFGISDKTSFNRATNYASGAIVGSAFVKFLSNTDDYIQQIPEFVKSIRD